MASSINIEIDAMIEGLRQVAALADPVGEISELRYRPSGIQVGKMRVPLGVIGIIYESRPNVTVDAAALCLKSGNASILRGGKEALYSNQAIYRCIKRGLRESGMNETAVQVVDTSDREAVAHMLRLHEFIDVIIPRGGKSLIERISQESRIPVIKHLDGVCHVYIDDHADLQKALDIAINAKTRRYGVCNAMETLLVAAAIAPRVLPDVVSRLADIGVELRGCERTREYGASILAEKLREVVADNLFEFEGERLGLTMTFGLARYHKGETLDSCVARADTALYQGKEQGRNTVMIGSYKGLTLVRS